MHASRVIFIQVYLDSTACFSNKFLLLMGKILQLNGKNVNGFPLTKVLGRKSVGS